MKKTIPIILVLLLNLTVVWGVEIDDCKSYGESSWDCVDDDICVCEISGECTDGRLLVYENDIRDLLCAPPIEDGHVDIDWDDCWDPEDEVKIRADCMEGQSEEEIVYVVEDGGSGDTGGGGSSSTTTTTFVEITCEYVCQSSCTDDNNPPFCYKRVSHGNEGCPGGTVCCQSIIKNCPSSGGNEQVKTDKTCPYECCVDMPGYEYKPCSQGQICCNHLCKESCEETDEGGGFKISRKLILWVLIASLLPIVAFLIFVWKKGQAGNIPEY